MGLPRGPSIGARVNSGERLEPAIADAQVARRDISDCLVATGVRPIALIDDPCVQRLKRPSYIEISRIARRRKLVDRANDNTPPRRMMRRRKDEKVRAPGPHRKLDVLCWDVCDRLPGLAVRNRSDQAKHLFVGWRGTCNANAAGSRLLTHGFMKLNPGGKMQAAQVPHDRRWWHRWVLRTETTTPRRQLVHDSATEAT